MGTVHGYTGASNSSEIDQIWCLTADLWSYIFFSLFIHWEKQGQPTKMADTMPAGTCWSWSKFSSMHPFIWVQVRTVVVIDFFIPYLGLVGNYLQFNLRVKKRKEIGGIKGIFSWYVWFVVHLVPLLKIVLFIWIGLSGAWYSLEDLYLCYFGVLMSNFFFFFWLSVLESFYFHNNRPPKEKKEKGQKCDNLVLHFDFCCTSFWNTCFFKKKYIYLVVPATLLPLWNKALS